MQFGNQKVMRLMSTLLLIVGLTTGAIRAQEAESNGAPSSQESLTPRQIEIRASRMVANARQLLQDGDQERAVGILEAVGRMFPESQARYQALLELGRHLIERSQYEQALQALRQVADAESAEWRAEGRLLQADALAQTGRTGDAMMLLRRITQDFPTSPFANDAYAAIGQIHFEAGRWTSAAEAFRSVGTAVPVANGEAARPRVEAGQQLFVHVADRDLSILDQLGTSTTVDVFAKSGDRESLALSLFNALEGEAMASIETRASASEHHDGVLTVHGEDVVTVVYIDRINASGQHDVKIQASADVVSSGVLAFMDGAYRQRVQGIFIGQPAFLRLRDLDLDLTPEPDTAQVTIRSLYRRKATESNGDEQAEVLPVQDAEIWDERASVSVRLRETDSRSGIFKGHVLLVDPDSPPDSGLPVAEGDRIVAEYVDERHIDGFDPVPRRVEAVALLGGSTEPQSIVSSASDPTVQARKLLLEARLYHQWAGIFKDVGLDNHAHAKADEGLERIEEIMGMADRFSLDRSVAEAAYVTQWDLYLIQDRLDDAIAACHALIRRYPDSVLADQAFLQIASARTASDVPTDIREGIRVFQSILRLPQSDHKAEAQFGIAEALEKLARLAARDQPPNYAQAIAAYRICAETYPESAYAGESFQRIVTYYINMRDHSRAVETLERVFQDYPDAPWLDEMLLRWGIALFRMGNRQGATEKFNRILEEYPGGDAAQQVAAFLDRLR